MFFRIMQKPHSAEISTIFAPSLIARTIQPGAWRCGSGPNRTHIFSVMSRLKLSRHLGGPPSWTLKDMLRLSRNHPSHPRQR